MDGAIEALLENRPVDFVQLLFGQLVFDADHDAIGMQKIADRGAFAQEFRIRCDAKFGGAVAPVHAELALELLAGLRRDGAFLDHQFRTAGFGADDAGPRCRSRSDRHRHSAAAAFLRR